MCINGLIFGYLKWYLGEMFRPSKGLRQGDPLSPYLFLICAEGLSSLLNLVKQDSTIRGERVGRRSLVVTHLFFAYDNIFFGEANEEGAYTRQRLFM